ncbi:MAG: serine--glyoxylate aminotransferase [Betaproteobacteria bacterium RIFCSPLOWO2_12_FULL_63_13]|nr:MAG: serine--glyoxylate aminotransferase [Betaproteobacteria bacterium RIFCSPLOWO2_02_FULL_63_19]OGA44582.1 MAG: serine--glyoxylate aminotransferase [Betaproteobacteria bacterium RIFCSPLOWO2_12_FULL_63_13]
MAYRSGRHFLQIPGPTNLPDRVLRAMNMPTIDHRGPEFGRMGLEIFEGLREMLQTRQPVVIYPASGTGAWEAALVNTLSPGDRVLMFETGQFAALWSKMATRLGLQVEVVATDWRRGVDPAMVEAKLKEDHTHAIRALCVVHNETSTGVTSRIGAVRAAIDAAGHPALFMVDTISSLACIDYRHDEWGVDVTIAGSQKGLMLPPGLSFNCVGEKALAASKSAKLPKSYWAWEEMLAANKSGFFPYTPATNLLYGLREALRMLREEGLQDVFARHARHAEATRRAVRAWGLEIVCAVPTEYSNSLTAVMTPQGHDADALRRIILDAYDMSLGTGLGRLAGKIFRIGHLGDFNDLALAGTLAGVEMGLTLANVPHEKGGVQAAMEYLAGCAEMKAGERRAA